METGKKKNQEADNSQGRSEDNFSNLFLKLCEQYDVSPLPKIVGHERARQKLMNIDEPSDKNIIVIYENPKICENPQKFECNGYEVSVCMLDALSVSVKKFQTLTTIRLPNCRINAYGITQIAGILVEIGCVRDVNLDLNPNIRENYYLLCTRLGKLQYLSLKYCQISDTGVERIARELKHKWVPTMAEESPQLIALDLSNNLVQDIGARHIADMLRTNRSLRSINLTGNRIRDFGAISIIQQLYMHSLTHDEIIELRRLNYCQRDEKSFNGFTDLSSQERHVKNLASNSKSSKRSISSRKSANLRQSISGTYAAAPIDDRESINDHPFSRESQPVEGDIIARGNFQLQHLNLSYNKLTDESLKKLTDCINHQSFMLEDTSGGLLHVYLEGNVFQLEENQYWKKFEESLNLRRSSKSQVDRQRNFEALVSPKARIFREKFRVRK